MYYTHCVDHTPLCIVRSHLMLCRLHTVHKVIHWCFALYALCGIPQSQITAQYIVTFLRPIQKDSHWAKKLVHGHWAPRQWAPGHPAPGHWAPRHWAAIWEAWDNEHCLKFSTTGHSTPLDIHWEGCGEKVPFSSPVAMFWIILPMIWTILAMFWTILAMFRPCLDHFGHVSAMFWTILARFCPCFGPFWKCFGPFWPCFGPFWGQYQTSPMKRNPKGTFYLKKES